MESACHEDDAFQHESGVSEENDGHNRLSSTPSVCDKPGPSKTPSTELSNELCCLPPASVLSSGLPAVSLAVEEMSSHYNSSRAHLLNDTSAVGVLVSDAAPDAQATQDLDAVPAASSALQPVHSPIGSGRSLCTDVVRRDGRKCLSRQT